MKDFKRIHEQENVDAAMTELVQFCEKYGKIYPKLVERLSDVTSFLGMSSKVCKLFCFKLNFHTFALCFET